MVKTVQFITSPLFFCLARLLFDYRVCGLENLRGLKNEPLLFASNHCSLIDGPLAGIALPYSFLPIRFLVTEEYFSLTKNKMPFVFKWISPVYTRLNGSIKVYRSKNPGASLKDVLYFLKNKNAKIWIFPEGARSKDGNLCRGRLGLADLHQRSEVPIIPVGITGNFNPAPFQNKISVSFGNIYYNPTETRKNITKELMQKIYELICV